MNKCKICNKECKGITCSKSCAQKLRWKDKNYRIKNIENREKTNIEKYGVKNTFQLKENGSYKAHNSQRKNNDGKLAFNTNKQIKTLMNKYGVKNSFQIKEDGEYKAHKTQKLNNNGILAFNTKESKIKAKQNYFRSDIVINRQKTNKNWKKFLEKELNVSLLQEQRIYGDNRHCDLLINNIGIEINPTFSHNSTYSYSFVRYKKENNPIDKLYHQDRVLSALKNNFTLISIFDWMDKDKIVDIIKSKLKMCENKVSASKCEIKEISQKEANQFLNLYHLQGSTNGQSVCYGLFYKDELVQVQTFGKPRYDKTSDWEAIRLSTKKDWVVIGGIEKGWKKFLKDKNPKSVISYNSLNISFGLSDKMQGFMLEEIQSPQAMFCLTKTRPGFPKFLRESSVRRQGIDRLLPDYSKYYDRPYDKNDKSTHNEEVLIQLGYVKVYDCGIAKYRWTSK